MRRGTRSLACAVVGGLVSCLAAGPAQAQGATLYVSASASRDPACGAASKANPFATIGGALGCLGKSGTIKVGAGTFAGGFTIASNVSLTGTGASTVIANPGAPALSLTEVTIADGHNVTLSSLTINGDGAQGDVSTGGGSLRVVNSTLTGGLASNAGPAITVAPGSGEANVTVLRSTLTDSHGLGGGPGAISVSASSGQAPPNVLSVIDSTIAGNQADGSGGGIAMGLFDSLTVRDSTISGNDAAAGGGIFINGSANASTSTTTLTDSLIAGNTLGGQGDVSGADCLDHQTVIDGGHNVLGVQDGCTGIANGVDGDQAGTAAAPLDPHLGPLAANGGPTQTMSLLAGSPAIDAGDAGDCGASPVSGTDQRNLSRHATTRFACDVGAYDTGKPLKVLHVKHSSHPDPSCAAASSAKPFATIAAALGCATSGMEIQIGAGTFAGGFTVAHNVVLLGAGPSTVITTPGNLTEVTIADGSFVTLENLKVDGGGAAGGTEQMDVRAGSGDLNIVTSTLTGGVAQTGAAIGLAPAAGTGEVLLLRSTVADNLGLAGGPGAIYVADGPAASTPNVLNIVNSTLADNQGGDGGAVRSGNDDSLAIRDSTISGNQAQSGGGIYTPTGNGRVTLTNVLLAANTASLGGTDCQVPQGVVDGGHNLLGVQDGNCPGITNGVHGDQTGTSTTPLNPMLGPLGNNGGPTQTMAVQATSPARGQGDPEDCTTFPVSGVDQRGDKRNAGTRLACDVGAYDTGS